MGAGGGGCAGVVYTTWAVLVEMGGPRGGADAGGKLANDVHLSQVRAEMRPRPAGPAVSREQNRYGHF